MEGVGTDDDEGVGGVEEVGAGVEASAPEERLEHPTASTPTPVSRTPRRDAFTQPA
jgi:hypothetical protein